MPGRHRTLPAASCTAACRNAVPHQPVAVPLTEDWHHYPPTWAPWAGPTLPMPPLRLTKLRMRHLLNNPQTHGIRRPITWPDTVRSCKVPLESTDEKLDRTPFSNDGQNVINRLQLG